MPIALERAAVRKVLASCRDQCARAALAARLLDLLPAKLLAGTAANEASALTLAWGREMASVMPSEDDLLWLGGVWLATANRIFGADSEMADALGLWFAVAAERALAPSDPGTV